MAFTTRAFATAIAATIFTQMALAVTPTAVWDCAVPGQGLNTTQSGLKINANYGVTVSDKITISSDAYGGAYIELPDGLSKVSVLVKYSNFSGFTDYQYYADDSNYFAPQFMAVSDKNSDEVGLDALNSATAFRWYAYNHSTGKIMYGGPTFPDASGYALFAYDNEQGMYLATGASASSMTGFEKTGYNFSGEAHTLKRLGLGGTPDAQYGAGWPGLVIEKVAIFAGEYYTAADVAEYEFPSEVTYKSDVNVSTINTDHLNESEIDVYLASGVTVTGDTTFTATKVNFHCSGSFTLVPPSGNTAVFDFSNVTGSPIIAYTGAFPSVGGTTFTANSIPTFVTESTQWTGTIWIKNVNAVNFTPNNFGNANSTVRLSGVWGHFADGSVSCAPAIELVNDSYQYGLYLNNGYSRNEGNPSRYITMSKLKGNGALWTGASADNVLLNVRDGSDYTGSIQLVNKIIVFGSTVPSLSDFNISGGIYVGSDATVTLSVQWRADGGIYVAGTLKADSVDKLRAADTANNIPATRVVTYDSGTFVLTNTSNVNDTDTDYSKITGTGTLKYESANNWRTVSTSNFPTDMIVQNELGDGLILKNTGATYTIGSLSGSKKIRTDWDQGDRNLRILQAKDTTYSGLFDPAIDRMGTVTVAPGTSTAGTLTLTGEQTANNNLVVESGAKVNLTGTWVGATTVAGTLGGMGTITGNLTLSDGATLDATGGTLTVSGNVTASSGTITVELPAGMGAGMKFLNVTGTATLGAKFVVNVGGEKVSLKVVKTADGLKAIRYGTVITLK